MEVNVKDLENSQVELKLLYQLLSWIRLMRLHTRRLLPRLTSLASARARLLRRLLSVL